MKNLKVNSNNKLDDSRIELPSLKKESTDKSCHYAYLSYIVFCFDFSSMEGKYKLGHSSRSENKVFLVRSRLEPNSYYRNIRVLCSTIFKLGVF